ncbi:hypothetical protein HK100_011143 [Physocladia obscura]|uniref:BZIP domain-containing protein n=1 Tax=Physocladia obscura TaxID=109957 RepID=A0AAD5XDG4_9FUNG|nr:hypothetical protein HK100_011143 [Physocladia obscura]
MNEQQQRQLQQLQQHAQHPLSFLLSTGHGLGGTNAASSNAAANGPSFTQFPPQTQLQLHHPTPPAAPVPTASINPAALTVESNSDGRASRSVSESVVSASGERSSLSPPAAAKIKNKPGRAAQRAFRERKENAFKELQRRVEELEQLLSASQQETDLLRLRVASLQEENEALKSSRQFANDSNGNSTRPGGESRLSPLAPTSYLAEHEVSMKEEEEGENNGVGKRGADMYAGYWNTVS